MSENRFRFSDHMVRQAAAKGFSGTQILSALNNPERVTNVTRYPGQKRYCGAGVAVVVDSAGIARTVYADRVVTPMREDQKNDPAAQRSKRLHKG